MSYFSHLPIHRFSKPMDKVLIDYVNYQNNKAIDYSFLKFSTPFAVGTHGEVGVTVSFSSDTGWQDGNGMLTYRRIHIGQLTREGMFIIHTKDDTHESIKEALFEQYGLYLDKDTYTLTTTSDDGEDDPENPEGDGNGTIEDDDSGADPDYIPDSGDEGDVDGSEGDAESEEVPVKTGTTWFELEFSNEHLLLEGRCLIKVVPSLSLLDVNISTRLKLREYYSTNDGKVPVELFANQYNFHVGTDYGSGLYHLKVDQETLPDIVTETLRSITGDEWVNTDAKAPFNLHGASVVYNGLRSDRYNTTDKAYRYVLVLELSDEFCDNLKGSIVLGYQNDHRQFPGYVGGRVIRPTPILDKRG